MSSTISTSDIDLTASSDVTLTGVNLEYVDLNLGLNAITLTVNKTSLDLSLIGIAEDVTVNGTDIDSLIIDGTTVIDTLYLNNLNFGILDLSLGTVSNIDIQTQLSAYDLTGNDLLDIAIDGDNLTSFTVNNTNINGVVNLTSLQTTLDLYGVVNEVNIGNDNLTTIDLTNIIMGNLILDTISLSTLDTLASVTSELDITTDQDNFNLSSNTPTIIFTSGTGNTMNLVSSLVGEILLNTVIDNLNIPAATTDFDITATNMNSLSGTINDLTLNVNSATGTFTFDLSANSVVFPGSSVVTVEFIGVNTISEIEVEGAGITSLNTNSVDVTSVSYSNNSSTALLITAAPQIELGTTTSGSATITYTNANPLVIDLKTLASADVTLVSAASIDVSGDVEDITIIGAGINTVVTDSLLVSNKLTMNNTLITDLEFVGTGLLNDVVTIEVNTLSNANIETILTKINGTSIDLISPIVLLDIYNYYYDVYYTDFTDQEALDSVRYDSFRTTAIDDAWDLIVGNEYMAHLDETSTRLEIDNQIYQTTEDYFDSYLTDQGTDEATYGAGPSATAKASIQAVLDDPLLTFTTGDIDILVVTEIEEDADEEAVITRDSITFTLS